MYMGHLAQVSNSVSWSGSATLLEDDATPHDLADVTGITLQVRDKGGSTILSATLGSGITLADDTTTGVFTWSFSKATMQAIRCPGTYDAGITVDFTGGSDTQLFVGTITVIDGVVR